MSFTGSIKQEIASIEVDDCCKKAQLCALLQLTSSLTISNKGMQLLIRSENPTCEKRIVYLLKKLYKVDTELSVIKKNNLKKNNIYIVKTLGSGIEILEDVGLYKNGLLSHPSYLTVAKNCCAKNYLAGCFLAYGTCNSSMNKNYHLELALNDVDHANFVVKLLARFNIEAKISTRRNKQIVYLKKAEVISDFLKLIGTTACLLEFEDARIERDFKHSLIRIDNCEIANEMKSLKAANEQIDYMLAIKEADKYKELDEKLKNVIDLRLDCKDYSLNELCDEYMERYGESISKSGLKHRLNKIESIARSL